MEIVESGFKRPYYQDAIGKEGLTSEDIARATGVSHKNIIRDIERNAYMRRVKEAGFLLAPFGANRNGPGRKRKIYAFETEAAKLVVAQSRTKTGLEYMRYLISCERAAEHGLPRLIARVAELEAEVRALSKPRPLPGPGRRHRVVAGFRTVRDLFGNDEKIPVYRDLAFAEMTDDERRAYEAQHLSKISSGASKKAAGLINHEAKPGKRSGKVLALMPTPKLKEGKPSNGVRE